MQFPGAPMIQHIITKTYIALLLQLFQINRSYLLFDRRQFQDWLHAVLFESTRVHIFTSFLFPYYVRLFQHENHRFARASRVFDKFDTLR